MESRFDEENVRALMKWSVYWNCDCNIFSYSHKNDGIVVYINVTVFIAVNKDPYIYINMNESMFTKN